LPIHENFTIGPLYPKISPAAPFNVYLLLMLVQGGPKSKQPGARDDLNPALVLKKVSFTEFRKKNLGARWWPPKVSNFELFECWAVHFF
jgi:hypothetical protein